MRHASPEPRERFSACIDLQEIQTWARLFNRVKLSRWSPVLSNPKITLGDGTALDIRQASKDGFSLLRENCEFEGLETHSFIWWYTQALKKFRGRSDVSPDVRAKSAITGFLQRNERCKEIRLPVMIRQRMREMLARALPCPEEFPSGHFGPGAVAERLNAVERWHTLAYFRLNPRTGAWARGRDELWHLSPESVARLCAVPKDVLRDRLITVEPAEHSFWQQALRDALLISVHSGPLRGSVMDMIIGGVPEYRQRTRCLRGSLTGHTTTLDLEDASDSIPLDEVLNVFPAWVTYWIALSRTDQFVCPTWYREDDADPVAPQVAIEGQNKPGSDCETSPSRRGHTDRQRPRTLHMYAGMGNASTFMVETLYFWALFSATSERLRIRPKGVSWAVTAFGDDIVVPTALATHPCFVPFIEQCGIRLNLTKSCLSKGPGFREACGLAAIYGFELASLISIKGPFTNDDIGLVNLCGLITRLDHSTLEAHNDLARLLFDATDVDCVPWDRPLDGVGFVLGKHLPPRGDVTVTEDRHLQRPFVRHVIARPRTRSYWYDDLDQELALGVLRGQLEVETRRRKGCWKSVIQIDVPHQMNFRTGRVYLPY